MTNFTADRTFGALHEAVDRLIEVLALSGVADAKALADRKRGWNNLQGHYRAVVPLAIWLVRRHPALLANLRAETRLSTNMSGASAEARDPLWNQVQDLLRADLASNGSDRVVIGSHSNTPETAQDIATTYLSKTYGGGQVSGQAGNTVLKRTLKLMAHTFPIP